MKLDFAFLADAATITDDGLFAVVGGGFDLVKPSSFPATKHAMSLVGRVFFDPAEMGKPYLLHGEIVGPDAVTLPPDMWLRITPTPHPTHPQRGNWTTICLNYPGVTFPRPGNYFIRLSHGEQVLGQVSLDVVPLGGQT